MEKKNNSFKIKGEKTQRRGVTLCFKDPALPCWNPEKIEWPYNKLKVKHDWLT